MVYCASRDGLFGHSCVYHDTFIVCLHVCFFCVFCVGFISCWLCGANHVKGTENMKSHTLSKNGEVHSCGVHNMIQKHLLEIETIQIPQSPTKNIVSFVLKNTIFALTKQINLH